MKYLVFLTLFLFSINSKAFVYENPDKNAHVAISLISTVMVSHFLNEYYHMSKTETYLAAFTTVMVAGILKENLYDDSFDEKDVEANVVGGLLAIPIIYITF